MAIPPAKYGREKVGWSDKTTGELLDKNSQQHFIVSYYELVVVLNFHVAIFVGSYCSNTMKYSDCQIFPKLHYFSIISMKFLDSEIPLLFVCLKISQYFKYIEWCVYMGETCMVLRLFIQPRMSSCELFKATL